MSEGLKGIVAGWGRKCDRIVWRLRVGLAWQWRRGVVFAELRDVVDAIHFAFVELFLELLITVICLPVAVLVVLWEFTGGMIWRALTAEDEVMEKLAVKLSKMSAPLPRFVRPSHVPEIGGCPPNCGHTEEQHAAFDVGVYDGEHGRQIPPFEFCQDPDQSRKLNAAWIKGYSVGVNNRQTRE